MFKNSLITLFLLAIFTTISQAQFRDYAWGTSRNTVIKEIENPIIDDGEKIAYKGKIANYDAVIYFQFINNQLHGGGYIFTDTHSSDVQYIYDFNEVNKLLSKKYGESDDLDSRIFMDPNTDSNEFMDEGLKLSLGAIGFQSIWSHSNRIILHKLYGDNHKINHGLAYKSQAHDKLLEKQALNEF